MSDRFQMFLANLQMEGSNGLVRADDDTLAVKRAARADLEEILALERASRLDADYVYFRRPAGRPPIPTALLFDWTERLSGTRESLADLHRRFWSAGDVPLAFVFTKTQVDIYHVLQGPNSTRAGVTASPWKLIKDAGDAAADLAELRALSARRLDDGSFWEGTDSSRLNADGAAFMALLRQLGECRATLLKKRVDDRVIKRLLILFIFIKYLEERKDGNDVGVFPSGMFLQFGASADSFLALINSGAPNLIAFVDHVARKDRFNGEVFALSAEERKGLSTANLTEFAGVLDGYEQGRQGTFWRQYAFDELPVELISHLYEQFLPRQAGVVYTPPFLVSFILDEVLPLSDSTPPSFRLIDPACGSGVFLVASFKRLVQRWRRDHDFQRPDVSTLKAILRDHVFGVDIQPEAVRIALFSLSVALCDFLQPRVIWEELHFDPLKGTNLFDEDFFRLSGDGRWNGDAGFDLVVGNPPFESRLSPSAGAVRARLVHDAQARGEPVPEVPDNQLALLFLMEALQIAKQGGDIALVQPTSPLLYNKRSSRFRRPFLQTHHVTQIVDLTHLSRVLFRRPKIAGLPNDEGQPANGNPGDVAVAVVFAERRAPTDDPLLHVTVRRTAQAQQKQVFEIDHYDLHFVPRREALENPRVWKANFIGGGRIVRLLSRFDWDSGLSGYLRRMENLRGWCCGEGYIVGDAKKIARMEALLAREEEADLRQEEREELASLQKAYSPAPWLTGNRALPTSAFTSDGFSWTRCVSIEERFFQRPRRPELFSGPLLLIKEVVEAGSGQVPVLLLDDGVAFKGKIFGIHAPIEDRDLLVRIRDHLADQRLLRFHLLATSSEYLINKSSSILIKDLLDLPFSATPDDVLLSPVEEALVDDVLQYAADYKRTGEGAEVRKDPTPDQLAEFGGMFREILGSVYPSLKAAEPVRLPGAICYPFYFGDAPSDTLADDSEGELKLEGLLTAQLGESLRCQRILRVFHGNMILLVKPAQLRYWLRSIAARDADELFVHLQGAGY